MHKFSKKTLVGLYGNIGALALSNKGSLYEVAKEHHFWHPLAKDLSPVTKKLGNEKGNLVTKKERQPLLVEQERIIKEKVEERRIQEDKRKKAEEEEEE
jgi:hypothetical protein